jgi:hypothetical protein
MAPKPPTPAQIAALKKSKGVKPTEAFTKPGQKATGLAKSSTPNRFSSTAKTPVRDNISGFSMRGSGTPTGVSMGINPLSKNQIINATIAATALGRGAGFAGKLGASSVTSGGTKAGSKATSSTSKTMSVPKGTKALVSNKSGMAKALSDVSKVTVQKSEAKVAAGKQTWEALQKRNLQTLSKAIKVAKGKGYVAGAATVQGIHTVGKPKKK